ncbi:2-C-methyl-D-erythritol 4-phosphate cytidylyltransferase [Aestuariibacter halophilus]|uniref:2-C-methyl-D-erythritol 4-phosphate cytidylyltransferase n=1 Tax=Fluctibacter halophilus TaxID=226011 RepID=A0ABS8GDV9_9ALTE|nr:2-C-methyl-D-erythritol 4-phosphate cytidylyltransferase [Aestuariibacter halophilus]MCC2617979.1 2-C-methyl-D-erythritol 4-phosphate cytidylyltransferase [Aestuariibacter halophilus]
MTITSDFPVVVPAAGVGKRMGADRPKQYLLIHGKTVLEHTLLLLLAHPRIRYVVVAIDPQDPYFDALDIADHPDIKRVDGGKERADSVLAGLQLIADQDWVLVHDAARPCVRHDDIDALLALADQHNGGGILATPVRDTMKRASEQFPDRVDHTAPREHLWHAQTPQFFPAGQLRQALEQGMAKGLPITDEASAMEAAGYPVQLVEGSEQNLKITRPDDLALAEYYLSRRTT